VSKVKERDTIRVLVGVLIGSIVKGAGSLAYFLYTDDNKRCSISAIETRPELDAVEHCREIVGRLGKGMTTLWSTHFAPAWYFVQLDYDWTPNRLYDWSLPRCVGDTQWQLDEMLHDKGLSDCP